MDKLKAFIEKEKLCVNFPLEVRFTGKDDIFLSSCEGWDSCWIGAVMYRPNLRDPPHFKPLFKGFEAIMKEVGGRPHWAKAFDQEGFNIRELFPRTAEAFFKVRDEMDPHRLFMNDFLEQIFK